jgi:hypothetical protein
MDTYSKEKKYCIEPWAIDILASIRDELTGEYKDVTIPKGMKLYGQYELTTEGNMLCFFVDELNNYAYFYPDTVYIVEVPWTDGEQVIHKP